jgi:sugar (pentulose or hexulose) kinase
MNMESFITLDMGTTSVKIALIDRQGTLVAESTREYVLETPAEDIVELNPEIYWDCCVEGIREVLSSSAAPAQSVLSISVSSQGETLICLDSGGRPLNNAIVWLDNRSKIEAKEIKETFGIERVTGLDDVLPTWPITKILWLKKNKPKVFSSTAKYLLVEDYILYRLSGEFAGEHSLYSTTYMYDVINKRYWTDILDYVGVGREQLVDVFESGVVIAKVTPDVCRATGLAEGTRVTTGIMDQTAGMVGAGNISEGIVTETTGSALVICETLDRFPAEKPASSSIQCHAVPGKYLVTGWCAAGGMSLKWLRDTFFEEEKKTAERAGKDAYDTMVDMAENVSPGSQGLFFYPFMSGPGTLNIDPDVRGVFYGLELHHGKAHFVRSMMEAIAYILRENIELMGTMGGGECREIRSMGGGSKSIIWNKIKADVTGKKIVTMHSSETACLGVAVLQAVAAGIYADIPSAVSNMVKTTDTFEPDKQKNQLYQDFYKRYIKVERKCFSKM